MDDTDFHEIERAAVVQTLRDANCDEAMIKRFLLLQDDGPLSEAIQLLSCHSCSLLSALHEVQKPIEILDYFIYKLKKLR